MRSGLLPQRKDVRRKPPIGAPQVKELLFEADEHLAGTETMQTQMGRVGEPGHRSVGGGKFLNFSSGRGWTATGKNTF